MAPIAERWKIEAVLAILRKVSEADFFIVGSGVPHSKTRAFLKVLDYRACDVFHVVRNLEVEDYSEGPLPDDKGRPRDLWVFGKYLAEYEVYIKLAIYLEGSVAKAICVSFHEAEWPLSYPYKRVS